ncbi:MAG: hypothetical protein AAGC60_01605 [Acidobacteriota bacterium]
MASAQPCETEHPTPEVLLAYHERRLPSPAREALLDHLALCPRCSRAVLDLARFPRIEARAPDPTDGVDLAVEIDTVRRRLRELDQPTDEPEARTEHERPAHRPRDD